MKDVLTPKEIELLPFAPFLFAMELAMRFLEDYLHGIIYVISKLKILLEREHNYI